LKLLFEGSRSRTFDRSMVQSERWKGKDIMKNCWKSRTSNNDQLPWNSNYRTIELYELYQIITTDIESFNV